MGRALCRGTTQLHITQKLDNASFLSLSPISGQLRSPYKQSILSFLFTRQKVSS